MLLCHTEPARYSWYLSCTSMLCLTQLVLALGMMVNSPITAQLPASLLWPLIPLMANRVLEALCFLLGYITPLVRIFHPHIGN